jgi:hypothetical protein
MTVSEREWLSLQELARRAGLQELERLPEEEDFLKPFEVFVI